MLVRKNSDTLKDTNKQRNSNEDIEYQKHKEKVHQNECENCQLGEKKIVTWERNPVSIF